MADIQLDVASANRFISSLSKSLQALCHGCMDFDAGIEVVGYINVNIDSGNKVDYVLNEKVLKSTTNSMTFVSNSFLAKKEETKTHKDGSCSPIPELNYPQQRTHENYSYPATQLYRSSGIYSPHSQVVRGSQKRQWSGVDWRMSPRKYSRGAKSQYGTTYQQQQSSSSTNESYSPYSNQQMSSTGSAAISSQQSLSTPHPEYEGSGGNQSQSDVNIKKEVEDSAVENAGVGADTTDQTNSGSTENINIKADPDAVTNQELSENMPSKSETDISNSFLEQPTKSDDTPEDPDKFGSNQDNVTNYDPSYDESVGVAINPGNSGDNVITGADNQGQSSGDTNYEESGEMFSESYTGEGTSEGGGGQFEVIEIDDDDEDVAAMFSDTHDPREQKDYLETPVQPLSKVQSPPSAARYSSSSSNTTCTICNIDQSTLAELKYHLTQRHAVDMPFQCTICGKGFLSGPGLKQHVSSRHEGRKFPCHLCESKFFLKHHLKKHLLAVHGSRL